MKNAFAMSCTCVDCGFSDKSQFLSFIKEFPLTVVIALI